MTLGTWEDAVLAQEINDSPAFRTHEFYLANGGYRFAYLINGVVYKTTTFSRRWANERELRIYDELDTTGYPDWLKIPLMTGYSVGDQIVIAAEFVPGKRLMFCDNCDDCMPCDSDGNCMSEEQASMILRLGFLPEKFCYGNTIQHVDGTLYIVDLPD